MVELTFHRKVVTHIIGVRQSEHVGLARLLAAGIAAWQGGKPAGAGFTLKEQGKPISQMVLEDRA